MLGLKAEIVKRFPTRRQPPDQMNDPPPPYTPREAGPSRRSRPLPAVPLQVPRVEQSAPKPQSPSPPQTEPMLYRSLSNGYSPSAAPGPSRQPARLAPPMQEYWCATTNTISRIPSRTHGSTDYSTGVSYQDPMVTSNPVGRHSQVEERDCGSTSISTLPLGVLHRILSLTLDPRATPEYYEVDMDAERARRRWAMFRGLRPVDRRFFLVATSILRAEFLPAYRSFLPANTSSNPIPPAGTNADPSSQHVFAGRARETAVLDRFVAVRVGEDMRQAESALCEDLGYDSEVLRLQPAARMEDLLPLLPQHLVLAETAGNNLTVNGGGSGDNNRRHSSGQQSLSSSTDMSGESHPNLAFPLPHTHLAIAVSPLWAQLYLSYAPVAAASLSLKGRTRVGRIMVCEVRRQRTPEDTVRCLGEALGRIHARKAQWGARFS